MEELKVGKGLKGGTGSSKARVDEQKIDLVSLVKLFILNFQVLSDNLETSGKSEGSWKSAGSAKSGEVSAFQALCLEALLETNMHDMRQEIDEMYHLMRETLHNPKYMNDECLSPGDETAVRDVLKYCPPQLRTEAGPGIANIEIQQIFKVVRVHSSEIDFSYHKCLQEKAAKECQISFNQHDFL